MVNKTIEHNCHVEKSDIRHIFEQLFIFIQRVMLLKTLWIVLMDAGDIPVDRKE